MRNGLERHVSRVEMGVGAAAMRRCCDRGRLEADAHVGWRSSRRRQQTRSTRPRGGHPFHSICTSACTESNLTQPCVYRRMTLSA